jgi:hypothetical protein
MQYPLLEIILTIWLGISSNPTGPTFMHIQMVCFIITGVSCVMANGRSFHASLSCHPARPARSIH